MSRAGRRFRTAESGFTLIEAMIAMVILVVGLTAVANLMLVASTSSSVANHMTATTAEASKVMDALKSIHWERLRCTPANSLDADLPAVNTTEAITDNTGALASANLHQAVPGVGLIRTRLRVTEVNGNMKFITVTSESMSAISRGKAAVTFTTMRTCTVMIPDAAGNPRCATACTSL